MSAEKDKLVSSMMYMLSQSVTEMLKLKNIKYHNTEEALSDLLGVNSNQLANIVIFIVDSLPNQIYLDKYQSVKNYFQLDFTQSLILFLIQEDIKSEYFENSLINFKNEILNNIVNNIYIK